MLKKKKSFGALAVGGVIVVFWKDSNSPHVSLRISWHCRMFLTLRSVILGVCVGVVVCQKQGGHRSASETKTSEGKFRSRDERGGVARALREPRLSHACAWSHSAAATVLRPAASRRRTGLPGASGEGAEV